MTRVLAGSDFVPEEELGWQTEVSGVFSEMEVGEREIVDGRIVRLPLQLCNISLKESAALRQIGVYSMDPEEGEILYQLTQYANSIPIPAYMENSGGVILIDPELDIWFENADQRNSSKMPAPCHPQAHTAPAQFRCCRMA